MSYKISSAFQLYVLRKWNGRFLIFFIFYWSSFNLRAQYSRKVCMKLEVGIVCFYVYFMLKILFKGLITNIERIEDLVCCFSWYQKMINCTIFRKMIYTEMVSSYFVDILSVFFLMLGYTAISFILKSN